MRAILQRVTQARVVVEDKTMGSIDTGLMVLLGIGKNDTEAHVDMLLDKICKLRIFTDDAGKMNKSLVDIDGQLLVVSQFTLYANTKRGNRPSFTEAASPDIARALYEYFIARVEAKNLHVQTGVFGAEMRVQLCNDGPVTIMLDTEQGV